MDLQKANSVGKVLSEGIYTLHAILSRNRNAYLAKKEDQDRVPYHAMGCPRLNKRACRCLIFLVHHRDTWKWPQATEVQGRAQYLSDTRAGQPDLVSGNLTHSREWNWIRFRVPSNPSHSVLMTVIYRVTSTAARCFHDDFIGCVIQLATPNKN